MTIARESAEGSEGSCLGEIGAALVVGRRRCFFLVHGDETARPDSDAAVYHRIVHGTPDAHGTQHRAGVLITTYQLQPAAVDHEQIGALAHGQLPDVVPAQQPRTAPGGHFEDVIAGGSLTAGVQPVQQEGYPQFLQQA